MYFLNLQKFFTIDQTWLFCNSAGYGNIMNDFIKMYKIQVRVGSTLLRVMGILQNKKMTHPLLTEKENHQIPQIKYTFFIHSILKCSLITFLKPPWISAFSVQKKSFASILHALPQKYNESPSISSQHSLLIIPC